MNFSLAFTQAEQNAACLTDTATELAIAAANMEYRALHGTATIEQARDAWRAFWAARIAGRQAWAAIDAAEQAARNA